MLMALSGTVLTGLSLPCGQYLKSSLSRQPCDRLLTCPHRQLLYEGPLTLMESPKPIDVHLFLFDDLLLITKPKKMARKLKQGADGGSKSPSGVEGAGYVVFRQPLAMDRFLLHDIPAGEASANGLKQVLVLIHVSRFQQVLGVFTLQAASDSNKVTWLNAIREAQEKYIEKQQSVVTHHPTPVIDNHHHRQPTRTVSQSNGEGGGGEWLRSPPTQRNSVRKREGPTKSRSMDAVFM